MGCGIGCGERPVPRRGSDHGDRGSDCCLSNTAFTHGHDDAAVAVAISSTSLSRLSGGVTGAARAVSAGPAASGRIIVRDARSNGAFGQEGRFGPGQVHQACWHGLQCFPAPRGQGIGNVVTRCRGEHRVECEPEAPYTEFREFASRALGLPKRRTLRTADENHGRLCWIGQLFDGCHVKSLLPLQTSERPKAGCAARRRRDKAQSRPRAGSEGARCGLWARCRKSRGRSRPSPQDRRAAWQTRQRRRFPRCRPPRTVPPCSQWPPQARCRERVRPRALCNRAPRLPVDI